MTAPTDRPARLGTALAAAPAVSASVLSPQETVERMLALSQADSCVVRVTEQAETNLRWANNTATTNGEMRSRRLAVISVVNGVTGTAVGVVERSAVTADLLEELVRAAERAAADSGPAEDAEPLVEPEGVPGGGGPQPSASWDDEPATTSVAVFSSFAPALGAALHRAAAGGRRLFGFAEHVMASTYLGSSTGLRLRHDQPTGKLELNAKSADGASSAWVGAYTGDFSDVAVPVIEAELDRRLGWGSRRVELPAGRYETILPPAAVADLLGYLYWTATAREADEGRTVFSRPGGGSRIGERLSELPLTLRSDPAEPGLQCAPFVHTAESGRGVSIFDNGLAIGPTTWMSDGVLTELVRTRSWARRTGAAPAPFVDNLVLESRGAVADVEAMIASTGRGLLLTCLWYLREVDPRTLLLTGLTRDGVYLVEGGEVVGEVNNFRFNESPVGLLGRVSEAGRTEHCLCREFNEYFTRSAMPALRVPDFNMSTVSKAS
jgi:predicted Zn-dependent protease